MSRPILAEYAAHGWAIIPIELGQKGPTAAGWNLRERCITDPEIAEHIDGNVGLAHAYSGTCAVDLDDLKKASEWLSHRGIDVQKLLDAPDSVMISSGRENRAKLLYRIHKPLPSFQLDGFELRCAARNGKTVQDVLPPSIHPETQKPYEWKYGEPMVGHWSLLPELPKAIEKLWLNLIEDKGGYPRSEGPKAGRQRSGTPANLQKLREQLQDCDPDCDYHEWIRVGMALHHETGGDEAGLDTWNEWSATAKKYKGREDLVPHWRSFKSDVPNPVTAASLRAQSSADEFSVLPSRRDASRRSGQFVPNTRSAQDLITAEFAPPRWTVNKYLTEGLFLLVAAPKIGKSWLALLCALAVASGGKVLGQQAECGSVLYLALEDNDRRLQSRLQKLDADKLTPEQRGRLHFETRWPRSNEGGIDTLDAWLTQHSDTRLVAIDVLERFRPLRSAKGNAYGEDYAALQALQALASKHRVTILVIHHVRKGEADDPMELISGTQGLAGAADGALIIKRPRGDSRGELHVIARDLEDEGAFVVEFDRATCTWQMVGRASEVATTSVRQQLLDVLARSSHPLSATELSTLCGKTRQATQNLLTKLWQEGMVSKEKGGKYKVAVCNDFRDLSVNDGTGVSSVCGVSVGDGAMRHGMVETLEKPETLALSNTNTALD